MISGTRDAHLINTLGRLRRHPWASELIPQPLKTFPATHCSDSGRPMLRRLLNIGSIVCLVSCVALMGMWVRSYDRQNELRGRFSDARVFAIDALPGRLHLEEFSLALDEYSLVKPSDFWPWGVSSAPINPRAEGPFERQGIVEKLGFDGSYDSSDCLLILPYWFLVLATGSLAMIFQLRWPWRFTLRNLFVATTFLAVVLGMIAWLDRAWIGK
jgi:hypothetical protein